MGRLSTSLIVVVLGTGVALGLVACGGEDADLLPGDTASEINANLNLVRQLADDEDCAGAADAAATVSAQVEELGGVDAELKRALSEGAARLNEVVARCDEEVEPEAEEPVVEEAEEPEEEENPKPDKAERDEEKEAEEAETSPTLPPQAEGKAKGHEKQEEEAPPSESGGTPSGGLESAEPAPGGAAEGGG
jgi:outer membrane biosynthesis protein TonB